MSQLPGDHGRASWVLLSDGSPFALLSAQIISLFSFFIFIKHLQLSESFSRQQLMLSSLVSEVSSLFWENISRGRFLPPFSCLVTRATQFPHAIPEGSGKASWLLLLFYITTTKADWQFSPLFPVSLHLKLLLPFLALLPHFTCIYPWGTSRCCL